MEILETLSERRTKDDQLENLFLEIDESESLTRENRVEDIERQDAEKVNRAIEAIEQDNMSTARRLLEEVAANTPEEYVYSNEEGEVSFIKFWDEDEFLHYIAGSDGPKEKKHIQWILSAYPRAFFYLAYLDMEEGMPESAIVYLQSSLKLEPDQPRCYCEMALAHSRMGQHEKALSFYDQGLQSRPHITAGTKGLALRGKGVLLIEFGDLDLAKKCLLESLKYAPGNPIALQELEYISHLKTGGKAVPMTNDLKKVAPAGRKCLVCRKEIGAGFNGEFKIMNLDGKLVFLCPTCAEDKRYKEAIAVNSCDAEAYHAEGEAYGRQERFEEAADAFKKAISIKPDYAEAHFHLGWVSFRLGKYDEAIKAYQGAIRIVPNFPEACFYLGIAYGYLGDREKSIENVKKAIQINPNFYEAHFFLGHTHLQYGNCQEAIESFKQASKINPDSAGARFGLGLSYQNLGQYDNAMQALWESLRINPDDYDSYIQLGNIHIKLGRYKGAVTCYNRALETNPKALDAWGNKGFALSHLGKYEDAIPCYEKILETNPEDTWAWTQKGYALSCLGRNQEAIEAYKNSIKFPSPEAANQVKEIKGVIKNLQNQSEWKARFGFWWAFVIAVALSGLMEGLSSLGVMSGAVAVALIIYLNDKRWAG